MLVMLAFCDSVSSAVMTLPDWLLHSLLLAHYTTY